MKSTQKVPADKSIGTLRATCTCTSTVLLRVGAIVCATCLSPVVSASGPRLAGFSQRDGDRPLGCSRERFLDVWKRAHDAADDGATADGRTRLLTHEAYDRFARVRRAAVPLSGPRLVERSVDDQVLADLGLARVGSR
jgi:hypothetical protein